MKKLVTWVVLGLFVVIVPFGSWYYLNQGLKYRKNIITQLKPKDSLDINDQAFAVFKGKTSLIILDTLSSESSKQNADKIYAQYKDSYSFQICSSTLLENSVILPDAVLALLNEKYSGKSYMLIDTSGKIRNMYGDSDADLKLLVEHLAVILPRPVETDIMMKQ